MAHKDRDRLVVLKKAQKRLVRQREAAEELQQTEWHRRRRRGEAVHLWRDRKHSRGDMVQGDTSEHDWREGRGPKFYLIHIIDDATSALRSTCTSECHGTAELTARLVPHDSTEDNLRLLKTYRERHGRPLAFYTDKASLFQTAPKIARDHKQLPREERDPLPPAQIGRALGERGIAWIAAHSPQAKGRVERSFQTKAERRANPPGDLRVFSDAQPPLQSFTSSRTRP